MVFVEAPAFTKYLSDYLDDDAYRDLQAFLAANPESGDLIPGTGGFRKLRWPDRRSRRGSRGGLRVIYYLFAGESQLWLMTIYGKAEMADLSPGEKRTLKQVLGRELAQRSRRSR